MSNFKEGPESNVSANHIDESSWSLWSFLTALSSVGSSKSKSNSTMSQKSKVASSKRTMSSTTSSARARIEEAEARLQLEAHQKKKAEMEIQARKTQLAMDCLEAETRLRIAQVKRRIIEEEERDQYLGSVDDEEFTGRVPSFVDKSSPVRKQRSTFPSSSVTPNISIL